MMRHLLVFALLLFATVSAAAEPWAAAYADAMTALKKSDWPAAARHLEKAIAGKGKEEALTRLSRGSGPYLPHYWLGTARLQQGDRSGALNAFRTSLAQGAIQKTAHYADLRKAITTLESGTRGDDKTLDEARMTADASLKAAVAAKAKATSAGAVRTDAYRRGSQKLQDAFALKKKDDAVSLARASSDAREAATLFASVTTVRTAAAPPRRTVASPSPVAEPAPATQQPAAVANAEPVPPPAPATDPLRIARAEKSLRALKRELQVARDDGPLLRNSSEFSRAADEVTSAWEKKLATGATNDDVAAIERGVAQQRAELARLIAESRATKPAAVAEAPKTRRGDTAALSTPLRESLRLAYVSLARGDYERAEAAATEILSSVRSYEAMLLRGCARYTRAQLTNQKDAEAAAASDFASAVAMNGAARLDPRFFSPKLIDFFHRSTR